MIFTSSKVQDIRQTFIDLFRNKETVIDRTGAQVVEIVNASFIANEDTIFGTANDDWNERELEWYLSRSRNVNDIPPPIPKIWLSVADENGFINSNYGWCIFSFENGNQFNRCYNALAKNPDTRQAIMIYNRPSMHNDAVENGRQDFMCCMNVQYFIRNNELISIVNFRSNDAVFGYKGDLFWNKYVTDRLYNQLLINYPLLQKGPIIWNAASLHVYSRHFHLIEKELKETIIRNAKAIRNMTTCFMEENNSTN